MDWQVEKKKERTERHQWSIVCSQDDLSNSSRSQYIKQTQIYYTICSDMFYKYKLHHLCFFGLIKEQFCIQGNVCEYTAHIHTTLPPKVWYVSNHFQCRKGKKKNSLKWTLQCIILSKLYKSTLLLQCVTATAVALHQRQYYRESDMPSPMTAIFRLGTGLTINVFPILEISGSIKQILEADHLFTHNHLAWDSCYTVMSYSIMWPHTTKKVL